MNESLVESGEQINEPKEIRTMREIIPNARQHIEDELRRVPSNAWIGCFSSVVGIIKGYFDIFKFKKIRNPNYSAEEYVEVGQRVEFLHKRLEEVKAAYGTKTPPPEVQEELMALVDVFRSSI